MTFVSSANCTFGAVVKAGLLFLHSLYVTSPAQLS